MYYSKIGINLLLFIFWSLGLFLLAYTINTYCHEPDNSLLAAIGIITSALIASSSVLKSANITQLINQKKDDAEYNHYISHVYSLLKITTENIATIKRFYDGTKVASEPQFNLIYQMSEQFTEIRKQIITALGHSEHLEPEDYDSLIKIVVNMGHLESMIKFKFNQTDNYQSVTQTYYSKMTKIEQQITSLIKNLDNL